MNVTTAFVSSVMLVLQDVPSITAVSPTSVIGTRKVMSTSLDASQTTISSFVTKLLPSSSLLRKENEMPGSSIVSTVGGIRSAKTTAIMSSSVGVPSLLRATMSSNGNSLGMNSTKTMMSSVGVSSTPSTTAPAGKKFHGNVIVVNLDEFRLEEQDGQSEKAFVESNGGIALWIVITFLVVYLCGTTIFLCLWRRKAKAKFVTDMENSERDLDNAERSSLCDETAVDEDLNDYAERTVSLSSKTSRVKRNNSSLTSFELKSMRAAEREELAREKHKDSQHLLLSNVHVNTAVIEEEEEEEDEEEGTQPDVM